ncbi:MAG TPA: formate dehydrogenase subunit delta [Dongiaceae bacterium]|jgi:formate dehydrogenase subunit delta|nr:formate dehydrogenase subunit delta [Dongiaceae bacterium]
MTIQRLVYMANQIESFFIAEAPDHAAAAIADHIRKYWDPRMRRQIFEHLAAHGGEGLKPAALAAIQTLAASDPAAKTAPAAT